MGLLSRIGKFFKRALRFEKENLKHMVGLIKKDPERLLIGAIDPFSTKLWSKILGKDYEPIINQFGGPTEGAFARAEAKGVNIGPASAMHKTAQLIAAFYAGSYGLEKLGTLRAGAGAPATAPTQATPTMGGAGTSSGALPATASATPANVAAVGPPAPAPTPGPFVGPPAAAPTVSAPAAGGGGVRGLFKGVGRWIKDNPEITGSIISGVGQGLMASSQPNELDIIKRRERGLAGVDPGRMYRTLRHPERETEGAAPPQRVSDRYGSYEYQYDPSQGRIVRVPRQGG